MSVKVNPHQRKIYEEGTFPFHLDKLYSQHPEDPNADDYESLSDED